MFYNRFVQLCSERKMSPTAVCVEIGIGNSAYSYWKQGSTPRDSTIQKIADYFGVTLDYMKGIDDSEQKKNPDALETKAPRYEDFMKLYAMLTPDRQEILRDNILALLKEQMQG